MPDGKTSRRRSSAAIATIGENITLRRAALVTVEHGVVGSYVHGAVAPGLGKIGVIVGLESGGKADALQRSASRSRCTSRPPVRLPCASSELDPAIVARERAIFAEQARESGKPEAIIEKMVEGRMRKFYEEVVLLSQTFVVDTEKTVDKALKSAEAGAGGTDRR